MQVFSYEIREIFTNTFFYRIPPVAAFEILLKLLQEKNYWYNPGHDISEFGIV